MTVAAVKPMPVLRYGPWIIELSSWLKPVPGFDWDWRHEDYDGPEDSRAGSGASVEDCLAQIRDYEAENHG